MEAETDWRRERRIGIAAIAGASLVAAVLWIAAYRLAPVPDTLALPERLVLALKCLALATLFCLVGGVEAVAHERLRSAAFDPLAGAGGRRLRVNQRYLQNTLEQIFVFAVGLLGLAAIEPASPRILFASTLAWIACRFAFWIGYHRSAAMRGLGAPGMVIGMALLLYLAWRIGRDAAGPAGGFVLLGAFALLELAVTLATRPARER